MSRRTFLRWLLATAVAAAAAFAGIWKLLLASSQDISAHGKPVQPDEAIPQPTAAASSQPAGTGGPLLSFFILSDLHVNPDLPGPSKHLKQAFDDIKGFESKVETLVMTGDLTDYGREGDYKELRSILNRYKLPPIYANMGNHDYYNVWIDKAGAFNREKMPNGKNDAQSREAFKKFFNLEQPYHEAWVNGFHFLMLSQEVYVQERPEVGEGAWYSNEQMVWLRNQLALHKDGKPVFVMIHQPLPPKGQNGGSHLLIRGNEFREILKPYPNVFVFSGHNHQDFLSGTPHYIKETFHWFHNSSVGRVLNSKYQEEKKDAAQGLYVQVYADSVTLRGREFSNRTWIGEAAQWTVPLNSGKV